jgi:xanthine dehydrogenase molybdenum-binding subunit
VAEKAELTLTVNGVRRSAAVDDQTTLLEVLREEFGLRAAKDGCSPQGQCGCCTVIVDGAAKVSCAIPAKKAEGRSVTTLEGFEPTERELFARCFVATAGLQCGFCIPGIVVRAKHLLDKNPRPTDDEVRVALDTHLCRCTGYVKIIDAIQLAAAVKRGDAKLPGLDERATTTRTGTEGGVGASCARYEGADLALGERAYIDDLEAPGMLHGAIRFSDHPRARVVEIDVSVASQMPGVRAIATATDVPGKRHQGLIYKDWPGFVAVGEETRTIGDVIAAVAADTRRQARDAAAAIRVEYDVLEPITSPARALEDDAPKLHPKGNLLSTSRVVRGDVDAALAASAHVVEGTWDTQVIEHLFLEPESTLVVPDGDRVHVYSPGQGVFDDQRQIASFLGVTEEKVTVELVTNGGAFGGKEDLSIQHHTALLARMTKRPVKTTLTRDESICLHPKRHAIRMHYTVGCDAKGRLTAVRARMIGDKGAYASVGSKVLERAAGHATGAYRVDAVDVEAKAVYTNNLPCGAMRGFGANQAAFAMDGALDMLAEKCGLDRWEIRHRNVLRTGDTFCTGQVLDGPVGLEATLLAVKDAFYSAKYAGIACGIKNTGIGNGMVDVGRVVVRVEPGGALRVFTGYTEMGQGLFTVLAQMTSEATGVPVERIRVTAQTSRFVDSGMTTASRATVLGGNAVRIAGEKLRADLTQGRTVADLAGREYAGEWACDWTTALGAKADNPVTHMSFAFATQVVIVDDDGRVSEVIAAHDVGRAINPKLCEGQLEGSVHMGLGYALSEDLRQESGRPVTTRLRDLGVLRAREMPEVRTILVEVPDPHGPYGARGVGEIGLVPTAPAVAGALHAFDGVRRFKLPMKDSPAFRLLKRRPARRAPPAAAE